MNLEAIFQDRKPGLENIHNGQSYVLGIPIIETEEGLRILFEVRGAISQPGDVCLPGGKIEPGEDLEEALRREMREELLISDEQIEMIGPSDGMISDWGRVIHTFVVRLKGYQGTFYEGEVADVFDLPLEYFLEHDPIGYSIRVKEEPGEDFPFDRISGGRNYGWHDSRRTVYFYDYETYTIWGLTARIMRRFAEIVREDGKDRI